MKTRWNLLRDRLEGKLDGLMKEFTSDRPSAIASGRHMEVINYVLDVMDELDELKEKGKCN